jgi:hypothetical protein
VAVTLQQEEKTAHACSFFHHPSITFITHPRFAKMAQTKKGEA